MQHLSNIKVDILATSDKNTLICDRLEEILVIVYFTWLRPVHFRIFNERGYQIWSAGARDTKFSQHVASM